MINEFQCTLFSSQHQMLAAIAYEYVTAGGANSAEVVDDIIAGGMTAASAAAEAIDGFGLDQADHFDDKPSHMDENGYTAADLEGAMAEFLSTRPDRATEA